MHLDEGTYTSALLEENILYYYQEFINQFIGTEKLVTFISQVRFREMKTSKTTTYN